MELAKYKACICEGAAENAIMDILLDADLLIFSREEMLEEAVIRCREGKKPSDFCKENLRMSDVKSYDYVFEYFSNPEILINAIKEYHRTAKIPKGEYTLLDLLK